MISKKSVKELITELNVSDESESLEAKLGSDVGKSILETICAFSNEPNLNGGTILVGVAKEEMSLFPLFKAIGVENPDKIITDIASQCSTSFNFPVRVDIHREMVGRACVIRIDVPELSPSQKPLYFKSRGQPRGAYRRIGSTDQCCNDDDLQAFYQTRSLDTPDRQIVEGASWQDIDQEAVDTYRKARAKLNPLAEELNMSDEDLLRALNGIDFKDDKIVVTRAGLVSFGKPASLRRLDPSNRVDYIRIPGKLWVSEPDGGLESTEIRGPTLRTIGRVISAILDDIPKSVVFKDGSPQRTDVPLIPERVIREAVVNALAHRNYNIHEPVQILRYSNRIEIRNPGYSLKSQERFDEPGSSHRNPHIAEILHETRYAEMKGSGIRVMRQKMRESGLTEPTFISSREDDKFSVIFLLHHFMSEEDWVWLSQFRDFDLDDEQRRSLIYLREMGAIDNACYRNLNQTDTLSASHALRKLKEAELIESRGSGSRTYYVAGPQFLVLDRRIRDSDKGNIRASQPTIYGSHRKVLPAALAGRVAKLGTRAAPSMVEALIVEICRWSPSSGEEIAGYLGKTRNWVTNKYLSQMVRDGRLAYTIPDMLKHPGQRYMVPDEVRS